MTSLQLDGSEHIGMGTAHHMAATGDTADVRIVDDDELAVQGLTYIQFDHVDAKSNGCCERSGCVFQDMCSCAAMSYNQGCQAVFCRFSRLLRNPPGFR